MHILQLLPSLEVGGVERGVLDLAAGLIRRGHRVSVVSAGGSLVEPLHRLGASHYEMPVNRKSPTTLAACVPALSRIIQQAKIDLVHARSRVPAWIGYLAARHAGKPFVTTCHGFYSPHPASRVMAWGKLVIVPSTSLGRYVIDRLGVPPERLRVIPRGVDLSQFQFRGVAERPSGVWRIGLVGRLTGLKGHDVAIQALALLLAQQHQAQLCVIGHAPLERSALGQRLAQLAKRLDVERSIEWWGVRSDVPSCLASMDVAIMPSTYPESFGRSAVEAQAIGVPVVASRLGGLAEVIEDGQTGLLVRPEDPSALAQAIARIMQEEPLRRWMIEQARRHVEHAYGVDRMIDQTLAVYEECLGAPRVVIWKLSAMGDVVLASPSLRTIRRQFPNSQISVVVGRAVYEAVARCPYVNDVVVYNPARGLQGPRRLFQLLRQVKRAGFDRSIDLQNSRLTHALSWLAGIPVRIGYARRWGWLLNHAVAMPREAMHPVAHQYYLLERAGLSPDGEQLELWPSDADQRRAEQLLQEAGFDPAKPIVGLHPGGSPRWKTKRWDLERWVELADRLAERTVQVIVTGAPDERALGERFIRLAKSRPFIALGRTSFMELACLIRRCYVFVTNDSAPLHLAAAMGTPAVALFGPTDPARHAPKAPAIRVIKKDVFCSPCYSGVCRTVTHACMKKIATDEVLGAVLGLLAQREASVRR